MGHPPLPLRFVTSAPDVASLPPSPAEVAVIGRSNVGKSSLLNALAGRNGLAKISSKPGKTRLLNVFALEGEGGGPAPTLVDLPGVGYAQVSKTERAAWQARMEAYLLQREPLHRVLVLVDGAVGPAKLDVELLAWLRAHDVPFSVVATKHDKVKSSQRERRKRDLAEGCGVARGEVLWVSATRNVGIDRLRAEVLEVLRGA